MSEIETIPQAAPRSQFNPLHIPCGIERKRDDNNNLVTTGNFKKGFEWITDEGVICCEHLHGTNIELDLAGTDIVNLATRGNSFLSLFVDNPLWFVGVDNAKALGMIPFPKENKSKVIAGTVPFGASADTVWYPRTHQIKRMKYGQWGKKPKTIENISSWLKEDLQTHLPLDLAVHIGAGKRTHGPDNTHNYRPFGLLFVHPAGMMARINCRDFPWYYEEGLKSEKRSRPKNSKTSKEEWESYDEEKRAQIRAKARELRYQR